MSHTPHALDEEFPDLRERIDALKTASTRFARLAEEYHEVNRQVHRIETRIEPASEEIEQDLKRRRMRLKDEIAGMLAGEPGTDAGASPRADHPRPAPPRVPDAQA